MGVEQRDDCRTVRQRDPGCGPVISTEDPVYRLDLSSPEGRCRGMPKQRTAKRGSVSKTKKGVLPAEDRRKWLKIQGGL